VLGSASLPEMRMYASEDRMGTRGDASCRFDLDCTLRITVTCHLSMVARENGDAIVGVPRTCIRDFIY
jgi:hypothetical protein